MGHLQKPGEWKSEETAGSRAADKHNFPDDDEFRFAGLLICDERSCREAYAVGGRLGVEHLQVDWNQYEDTTWYRIESFIPAPSPFRLDSKVPANVADLVKGAASLLWADHDAAANKIRQAVEALLDERGVKKYPRAGPRKSINTHSRIELFAKTAQEAAGLLMAVKWIGNEGSHTGGLTRDDILDALEMVEEVLDVVYVGRRAALARKVSAVIAKKGPIKAKKKGSWGV
jgi:hypothetical protein